MKILLTLLAFALFSLRPVFAEQTINLKDGSQIKGELNGIKDGIYTIKTPIIGDVHVAANDVASITNGNASPAPAPATMPPIAPPLPSTSVAAGPTDTNFNQQIADRQKQLMSDPENMAALQQMLQDPQIVQLLSDPTLVQEVTSHDYAAMQKNPRLLELMSNPKMQALLEKLSAPQQQQDSSSQ